MTIGTDGTFDGETAEEILSAMMGDAKEYFGDDLNESDEAVIRILYAPIASRLAEAQEDVGLVLQSAQLEFAEGKALDYLTALIGVTRVPASRASGTVTFSRDSAASQDYTIPTGTEVQTDSSSPTVYVTTETRTLSSGTTSVDAPVEAVNDGAGGNTGANTVTVLPDPPAGIQTVTNSNSIGGGINEEEDEVLRNRAKEELGKGSRASAPALINAAKQADNDVRSVSIFINDTNVDNTGSGGLPDHSFELIVENGDSKAIAQAITDTKAAGDTSYGGANGTKVTETTDLPNGQTHSISFSRPNSVKIYLDIDIDVTDQYGGDEAVRDSIIRYLGGVLSNGTDISGKLGSGDDVIYGTVEFAIREVAGVYDINTLDVDTSSPPSGTSNISILDSEVATADATDGSITMSTTTVSGS